MICRTIRPQRLKSVVYFRRFGLFSLLARAFWRDDKKAGFRRRKADHYIELIPVAGVTFWIAHTIHQASASDELKRRTFLPIQRFIELIPSAFNFLKPA